MNGGRTDFPEMVESDFCNGNKTIIYEIIDLFRCCIYLVKFGDAPFLMDNAIGIEEVIAKGFVGNWNLIKLE